MIRWLTAQEIAVLYRRPVTTVYWYAHSRRWRKADQRRPTLYRADDVEQTFSDTPHTKRPAT